MNLCKDPGDLCDSYALEFVPFKPHCQTRQEGNKDYTEYQEDHRIIEETATHYMGACLTLLGFNL